MPVKVSKGCSVGESFSQGENPIEIIQTFLAKEETWEEALLALRAIGAGSSPWARLLHLKACGYNVA
jgi:hypothetical protein